MTGIVGPDLLRAARAALNWSFVQASQHAGISVATVLAAEKGSASSMSASVDALERLRDAYQRAGVRFFDDGAAGRGITIGAVQS